MLICKVLCLFKFCSGHGSFSNNPKLNSVVGHLLHSSILVPYHGWFVPPETNSFRVNLFFVSVREISQSHKQKQYLID